MKKMIMLFAIVFFVGCASQEKLLYQDHVSYPTGMRGTVINWSITKIERIDEKEYYEDVPDFSKVTLNKDDILYVKMNVQNFSGEIWETITNSHFNGQMEVLKVERPINGTIRFLVRVPRGQTNYKLVIKRDEKVFDYFGNITIERRG